MNLVSKIQEINDYYDFRRAKRDHRNPSTGAFQAYERSGIVNLNYCIETGDRDACVHIPDKTGYLKISQEIDDNNGGGTPQVISDVGYEIVVDAVDYPNSDFFVVDSYSENSYFQYQDKIGDLLVFVHGINAVYVNVNNYTLVKATNNVDFIENVVLSRNNSGDLIASGTIIGSGIPLSFTFDVGVFTAFA